MTHFSAILFDLDGTLVDTIGVYLDVFTDVLQRSGVSTNRAEMEQWYMKGWHLGDILRHFNLTESDVPGVRAERDRLYIEALEKNVEWFPGAPEILVHVKAQYPTAVTNYRQSR